jgi:adenylate cyclase
LAAESRIDLRIGVNVGDVIADRDDIFGAGVNVAARLEQMCEPGGVCISGRVHEDIDGKVDAEFRDLGERKLKNIQRTVRVYALAASAGEPAAASPEERAKPPLDQPSIAVLPLSCLSEERELSFLVEAMTEDLIATLARIPGLLVIARQSSLDLNPAVEIIRASQALELERYPNGLNRLGD